MWLSWRIALTAAAVLAAAAAVAKRRPGRWRTAAAFARETALVLLLFCIWQLAADLALTRVEGAVAHGTAVWGADRAMHLPSELSVQQAWSWWSPATTSGRTGWRHWACSQRRGR